MPGTLERAVNERDYPLLLSYEKKTYIFLLSKLKRETHCTFIK